MGRNVDERRVCSLQRFLDAIWVVVDVFWCGEDGEDDGEEQKDARDSSVQPRMIHSPITVRAGKAPDTQATSRRSPSGGRESA